LINSSTYPSILDLVHFTCNRVQYKKVTQINMGILPQDALKGLNIPSWGNAPGKDYIFPKSSERAIDKNKYMLRPFRADWL
jgi:hypothetical protein